MVAREEVTRSDVVLVVATAIYEIIYPFWSWLKVILDDGYKFIAIKEFGYTTVASEVQSCLYYGGMPEFVNVGKWTKNAIVVGGVDIEHKSDQVEI